MTYPLTSTGKRLLRSPEMKIEQPLRTTKRRKEGDQDDDAGLTGLPDDVICNIVSFLDAAALLRVRTLNRSFRTLASKGSAGWYNLCKRLWENKVHVAKEALEHPDPMAAYRMSVLDARDRDYVTRDELVFDPETRKGTIWSFRFKESAGPDWTSWDPWFNGEICRKMVFLEDGSVKQYSENADSGELEIPSFARTGTLSDPPTTMTWRFLTRPLDLSARPMGSYVRFAVGGRDVPTYCVRRSPTKNWGFIMESCWGVYASFELPKRPLHQPQRRTRQLRRAQDTHGNWYNVEVYEDASDVEEGEDDVDRVLIDDESFAITSGLQWREAFLYNFGARVLPEGDEAFADFERTYGAALNA
jgi:hypothetical protein